jgi:hypothetical protein
MSSLISDIQIKKGHLAHDKQKQQKCSWTEKN